MSTPIEPAGFADIRSSVSSALFGVRGDRQGTDRAVIESVVDAIKATAARKKVGQDAAKYLDRLKRLALDPAWKFMDPQIRVEGYVAEHQARALQKVPKSKVGALAAIADALPTPPSVKPAPAQSPKRP